ncbi:MAG: aminotransferase class V-fold PLP-dependent enzyme [Longimicrobiales bacterium]|nr:aminotransferase class V-fold PLP-dependent enzyme [Longimicrobiales bacterium]
MVRPDRGAPPVVASFNTGPADLAPGIAEAAAEISASGLLALSHRGPEVKEVVAGAIAATRRALGVPDDYVVVTHPSATASMELALRNLVRTHSAHYVGGAFGARFADSAARIGIDAHRIEHAPDRAPDLAASIPRAAEVLTVTHNETSTGMLWPAEALRELRRRLHAERPDTLLAIDATSSLGGVPIDFTLGDIWFASVQKALGLPAGLALVIVGPRALERARRLGRDRDVAPWQDLTVMAERIETGETIETPNIFGLALLGRAMEGFDGTRAAEHCRALARRVDEAVTARGRIDARFFVRDEAWRSVTIHTLIVPDPREAIERARARGYVIAPGYRDLKSRSIRIATFPAHRYEHLTELLDILEGGGEARSG